VLDSLRYYLSRLGRWPRLVAAGICLTLAAASALDAQASPTVAVVVARHGMHAGEVVQGADVQIAQWPRPIAPRGAAGSVTGLIGRRVASAVTAGEPLSPARMVGTGLALGLPNGTRATAVAAADPRVADFIAVGDRVDLYLVASDDLSAPNASVPQHLATGLLVLAVLPPRASNDQQAGEVAELVVAVNPQQAEHIAVNSRQMFAVVVDPP